MEKGRVLKGVKRRIRENSKGAAGLGVSGEKVAIRRVDPAAPPPLKEGEVNEEQSPRGERGEVGRR